MRTRLVSLPVLLLVGLLAISCEKSSPTAPTPTPTPTPTPAPAPTTGVISGRVFLAAGQAGSVQNTRVAIYASYTDWVNDRVITSTSADSNGNYSFNNITPGTYYMDAWRDNNNSATFNSGDFFNVYGSGSYPNYTLSPFQVSAGSTTTINLQLFVI